MQILKVKNRKILEALCNHKIEEVAYCEEEDKYFKYEENGWEEIANEQRGDPFTLYQLNKILIPQLTPYTEDKLEEVERKITASCISSNYYLLYGKEIGYFTLFRKEFYSGDADYSNIGKAVLDCLKSLTDKIYSVDFLTENGAAEIWIDYMGEASVLYLCNWENGVVTYE